MAKGGYRKGSGRKARPGTVLMNFEFDRALVERLHAEIGVGSMRAFVERAIEAKLAKQLAPVAGAEPKGRK